MPQGNAIGITAAAATVGAAAGVVSYMATRKIMNERDDKVRAERHAKEIESKKIEAEKQKDRGEPSGTKLNDVHVNDVYLWEVEQLGKRFPSQGVGKTNVMNIIDEGSTGQSTTTGYNKLIGTHECVLADVVRKPNDNKRSTAYIRAGPRKELHFDPKKVNAAIVTCGGLCPGLNNVVREITNTLCLIYGTTGKVYGIRGGYAGFHDPTLPPMELTPTVVRHINQYGGTMLGSSRGGFDLDKIIDFLKKHDISLLYVIGGDGTHRGAFRIHEGCIEKGMNVAVAGVPKTIDNDVDYIDRSFGFASAVEAAQGAIRSAKTEAMCNLPNGIGIVKLMGRSAGYIALHSTMGSGDVDLCLVPEVPIVLDGKDGCLPHLRSRVKKQGYAVVVVAEGAGEELLGESTETDASGNKKLPKIGEFLKTEIESYFSKQGEAATVKYIDPSYMIRSVPANASDSLYCMQLAQNAVHGTMAGYTGFSVGLCNNKTVLLPIPQLVATSPRMMDAHGRTWERIIALTRQPNTVKPKKDGTRTSIQPALS